MRVAASEIKYAPLMIMTCVRPASSSTCHLIVPRWVALACPLMPLTFRFTFVRFYEVVAFIVGDAGLGSIINHECAGV